MKRLALLVLQQRLVRPPSEWRPPLPVGDRWRPLIASRPGPQFGHRSHTPGIKRCVTRRYYWRAMWTLSSTSGSLISSPLRSTVTVWMVPVKRNGPW
jgi:hypothetical protein